MESISVIERGGFTAGIVRTGFNYEVGERSRPYRKTEGEVISQILDCSFNNYLQLMGLAQQPDFMILSANSRFYYDSGDLRGIKTLISTRELNHVPHLDSFLFTIYNLLPPQSCFLGCFSKTDNKDQSNGRISDCKFRHPVMKPNDRRYSPGFSRQEILVLLESHGFKLLDLTEIKGITYFCTRIMKRSGE